MRTKGTSFWLLIFAAFQGSSGVELKKKVRFGNVSYMRIQRYTNKTLLSLDNEKKYTLGLDILMMADYSTFQGFVDMSDGDMQMGRIYTLEYLQAVFEQVKAIYDEIKILDQTIHMKMIGSFVAFREDDCPMFYALGEFEDTSTQNMTNFDNTTMQLDFEENNSTELTLSISAVDALDRFTVWLKNHESFLPKHDYAILITKFDLVSPRGESATQGMAYVGNICQGSESASIVEDVGAAATALIAAHELGHSLGAFHDGNPGAADCPSEANFLMAVTVSGTEDYERFAHSRVMSPCSVKNIERKLKKSSAQCVWKPKQPDYQLLKESFTGDSKERTPGEMIGLRQQCQIAFSPHYGVCPSKDYFRGVDLCHRIWCKDRTKKRSEPCETRSYLPALDGTECGKMKWCIAGRCVDNPKKMQECVDINPKTCRVYSKVKLRHYCKAKDFSDICCRSCSQLKDL
ncbi:unnamed protein product [Cylicocyclus nassatus]|uniref:Peptidase M12B domain-containing protein n=1 Tax=Cylicocyclus nassatus TaxID=53992 RepID=A0AA36DPW7_CYLNA|nr:unnamed protein product [Cylicocyclus nassatus]